MVRPVASRLTRRGSSLGVVDRLLSEALARSRPAGLAMSAAYAWAWESSFDPRSAGGQHRAMPNQTIELLSALVAIDSVNPSLVPGGAGEREAAAFVAAWAEDAGLSAEVLEATPGRPSVVARGAGGGRSLLLCGHLDTVTLEGMHDPRPR